MPAGKYQRSPCLTSSRKLRPSWSTALIRPLPLSMIPNSDCTCQCSSRYAPGLSFMSTIASSWAIGSSRSVISRVQPPSS